ncbi:MAG: PorT family protein [Cytophagales bacterium]|nr:PorT family protein [Cytophagales bacterium]
MKKYPVLIMLFCFIALFKAHAQLGFQVGGVATTDYAFVTYDSLEKVSGGIGFSFGVFYKHWLTDHLSVQPALNFINKRWWEELDDGLAIYRTKVSVNYAEIPVQLVFTSHKTRGFFAGAGPSVLIGLSGRRKVTENGNVIEDDKIEIGSVQAPEKRMTLALNAIAGYVFKRTSIGLNYTKGITNQPVGDADHGNVSHLTLRFGILFGQQ